MAVMNEIGAFLWLAVIALYVLRPLLDYWEVNGDRVTHRNLWTKTDLPLQQIVAVRLQVRSGAVEIEFAPISPLRYPHNYMIVRLANQDSFVRALQASAPHLSTTS
jgi:hypothetical protein